MLFVLKLQLHFGLTACYPYLAHHYVGKYDSLIAVGKSHFIRSPVGVHRGKGYLPAVVDTKGIGGISAEGGGYFSTAVVMPPEYDGLAHLNDHMICKNCSSFKRSHFYTLPFNSNTLYLFYNS